MPTGSDNPAVFLPDGNPDDYNETTLRRAGDLGTRFTLDGTRRQVVKMDSGATAAAPTGLPAANETAFWKDRLNYVVTNDIRFSEESFNGVAGIIRNATLPGNFTAIVTKGRNINLKAAGATYVAGDMVQANTSGNAADVMQVAAGTYPSYQPIGKVRGPKSGANVPVDIDLPEVP